MSRVGHSRLPATCPMTKHFWGPPSPAVGSPALPARVSALSATTTHSRSPTEHHANATARPGSNRAGKPARAHPPSARLRPLHRLKNSELQLFDGASSRGRREQRPVNVLGRMADGIANDDPIAFFVAFKDRAWPHTEAPQNLRRNGCVPARCDFRVRQCHDGMLQGQLTWLAGAIAAERSR
jgi:hypothetical protein